MFSGITDLIGKGLFSLNLSAAVIFQYEFEATTNSAIPVEFVGLIFVVN